MKRVLKNRKESLKPKCFIHIYLNMNYCRHLTTVVFLIFFERDVEIS